MGSVAEGLEQGDRLVVVARNLDLDAVHVGGPPAVPEHLVPRGLDIDQQVVDRRGPGEGGQQVRRVDGIDRTHRGRGAVPGDRADDDLTPGIGFPVEVERLVAVPDGRFFQGAAAAEVGQVAPGQQGVVVIRLYAQQPGVRVPAGQVGRCSLRTPLCA